MSIKIIDASVLESQDGIYLAGSKLVLVDLRTGTASRPVHQYLYPPVYLRKAGMLTLELPLLFLLMLFRMMSLNWNKGGFDHTIATLNTMSLLRNCEHKPGLNPEAELECGCRTARRC
jgi:hypothetical protein